MEPLETSNTDALLETQIHQTDTNHKETSGLLETLIHQGEQNSPIPLQEAQIHQAETNTQKIVEAVKEGKPEFTMAIDNATIALDKETISKSGLKVTKKPMKATLTIKGIKGDKGDKGDTGEKGEKGDSIKGEKGDKGDKGDSIKGDKGDQGEIGPVGPMGPMGISGPKGDQGEKGDKGDTGEALEMSGEQIVSKLSALKKGKRLSYDSLDDLPDLNFAKGKQSSKTYSLTEMDDVVITNPQNDQALVWDATLGKWINGAGGTVDQMWFPNKETVEVGETLLIPSDYQLIMNEQLIDNGGDIIVDGNLYIDTDSPDSDNQPIVVSSTVVTTNTTLTQTNGVIMVGVDATSGPITITLPSSIGNTAIFSVKKVDSSANLVTVVGTGGQTIDGAANLDIQFQWTLVSFAPTSSGWFRGL